MNLKYLFSAALISLLISFYLPTQIFAFLCSVPRSRYIVECENGNCQNGFKVDYKFTRDGCNALPYIIDFDEPEKIKSLFDYVFILKKVEQPNGIYELKVHDDKINTILSCLEREDYLLDRCDYGKYVELFYLSDEESNSTLEDWRHKISQESFVERVRYVTDYIGYVSIGLFVFGIVFLGPFFIIRKRLSDNKPFSAICSLLAVQIAYVILLILCTLCLFSGWGDWGIYILGFITFAMLMEVGYILWALMSRRSQEKVDV